MNLFHQNNKYIKKLTKKRATSKTWAKVKKVNKQVRPYGFKNLLRRKKPMTVTRQLTKSGDFRQKYLGDFHLRSSGSAKSMEILYETLVWRYRRKKNPLHTSSVEAERGERNGLPHIILYLEEMLARLARRGRQQRHNSTQNRQQHCQAGFCLHLERYILLDYKCKMSYRTHTAAEKEIILSKIHWGKIP